MDADSKLVVSYLVGGRDSEYAMAFMDDVAKRLANRVQMTTDGHKAYLEAVEGALAAMSIMRSSSSFTVPHRKARRAAIRRQNALASARRRSKAIPISSTFYVLCGTPKPDHADAHAPLHAPDQWLFEEGRAARQRRRPPLHVLQLRENPFVAADDPGDGRWRDRQALGSQRYRRANRGEGSKRSRRSAIIQKGGSDFKLTHYRTGGNGRGGRPAAAPPPSRASRARAVVRAGATATRGCRRNGRRSRPPPPWRARPGGCGP